jgi:hypothetical protein
MELSNRTMKEYDSLISELGKLYEQFVDFNKSELGPVSPNDHIIGPIGEWRAIQIIKKSMNLDARRVSVSSKNPDDLVIHINKKVSHYISVKTTTEHSSTGLSGIFHLNYGKWKWCICIRLNRDLTYKEHFWISKKDLKKLFISKSGKPKQFRWNTAYNCNKKTDLPNL